MKINLIAAVVLCMSASMHVPAVADEPCNMTLCMWGKVNGSDSEGCQDQIKKFFKKQVSKKGAFQPSKTADARKNMLIKECPSAKVPVEFINGIINKFGKLKG